MEELIKMALDNAYYKTITDKYYTAKEDTVVVEYDDDSEFSFDRFVSDFKGKLIRFEVTELQSDTITIKYVYKEEITDKHTLESIYSAEFMGNMWKSLDTLMNNLNISKKYQSNDKLVELAYQNFYKLYLKKDKKLIDIIKECYK